MVSGSILSKIFECCKSVIFLSYIIKASTFDKDVFNGDRTFTGQTFWFLFFFAVKGNCVLNVYGQFGYSLIPHL